MNLHKITKPDTNIVPDELVILIKQKMEMLELILAGFVKDVQEMVSSMDEAGSDEAKRDDQYSWNKI